jgi:SAM-dependent methyltransferase
VPVALVTAYRTDLAFIHDAGHGALARNATATLLSELHRAGHHHGTVVDLGCGSGILASAIVDAGYQVVGFDVSEAMIALACARAPKAKFRVGSFVSVDLPECVGVAAIGEVLNYTFDPGNDGRARREVFERVFGSLVPGGVFLFDVAGPDRGQSGAPHRSFATGPDWAVLVETVVDRDAAILTREITTFRKTGELFRRDAETHRLTLLDPTQALRTLRAVGFEVQTMAAYGRLPLPHGLTAFLARKQVHAALR